MIKKYAVKSLIILSLVAQSYILNAQSKAEVVAAFNKGAELLKTDTLAAIAAFEECILVCEKTGADGDSIKTVVSKIIPTLSFDIASGFAKAKNYETAITKYLETIKIAEKYGDNGTAEKSKNNLPQLYYANGAAAYGDKNYEKAIENLNKALEYNTNYANAYYVLAATYRSQKNYQKMEEAIDKTIETSKATNDKTLESKAVSLGKATFYNNFVTYTKVNNHAEAIKSMKSALKYAPEEKDYYFLLGGAYNKVKNYDEAIVNLKKGLEMETGSSEDRAKYYFEIGNALVAKKDNAGACEAYKNAQFGKYAENAKYQITTVLKCK
jgi:tetratricopeptide (TPR) repeat protein